MNPDTKSGQVETEKSEEELTQLLQDFEKNILGNITRSIEIADNFPRENTLDKVQNLWEEVERASTVRSISSFGFEKRRWEFLNPIVLYKSNWMGARTGGIHLEKGTYIIVYSVTSSATKGTGLASFNKETKRVETLLHWQIGVEKSGAAINVSGEQPLVIHSPSIINITDIQGNFNPNSIESIYIVTVFRVNTLPD